MQDDARPFQDVSPDSAFPLDSLNSGVTGGGQCDSPRDSSGMTCGWTSGVLWGPGVLGSDAPVVARPTWILPRSDQRRRWWYV